MRRFLLYLELKKTVDTKYASFKKEFPLTFSLFEREIFHLENGKLQKFQSNMRTTERNAKKNSGITNYIANLYSLFHFRRKSLCAAFIYLPRFPELQNAIADSLDQRGFSVITPSFQPPKPSEYLPYLRMTINGDIAKSISQIIASSIFTSGRLAEEEMAALELQLRKSLDLLKTALLKKNVKIIFWQTEKGPAAHMLLLAAKELEIRFITIAHGYIQDRSLISIAPIKSDFLVLWSESQIRFLEEIVEPECSAKLVSFGYPRLIQFSSEVLKGLGPIAHDQPRKMLFALHPLAHSSSDELEGIAFQIAKARDLGWQVTVRLHPKDGKKSSLIVRFTRVGAEFSSEALPIALQNSDCVVGWNSSVLMEALAYNTPSYQIYHQKSLTFPGVQRISSVQEVPLFRQEIDRSRSEMKPFQVENFLNACL